MKFASLLCVPEKPPTQRRSGCPVSISLERFGDRWSLMILRDMIVHGNRTLKTEKGIDLAPVLLELLIWAARHEETAAPCVVIDNMEKNRETVLIEVRRRWRDRDPTPLLPKFRDSG